MNSNKINLQQTQKFFEEQVDKIRIISDMRLTENEFRSLGAKLKSLSFFAGSENDIEDYMLSIIVYSTYSLIYGETGRSFGSILWQVLNNNQYREKSYLRAYKDGFYAYGLRNFDLRGMDFTTRCQHMTARHAGIPDCDKSEYFDLISNYLGYNDLEILCNELYENLPTRTKYIFGMMETSGRQQMLLSSRDLVHQVIDGNLSRDELVDKYPDLGINLIEDCILWDNNRKSAIVQVL